MCGICRNWGIQFRYRSLKHSGGESFLLDSPKGFCKTSCFIICRRWTKYSALCCTIIWQESNWILYNGFLDSPQTTIPSIRHKCLKKGRLTTDWLTTYHWSAWYLRWNLVSGPAPLIDRSLVWNIESITSLPSYTKQLSLIAVNK